MSLEPWAARPGMASTGTLESTLTGNVLGAGCVTRLALLCGICSGKVLSFQKGLSGGVYILTGVLPGVSMSLSPPAFPSLTNGRICTPHQEQCQTGLAAVFPSSLALGRWGSGVPGYRTTFTVLWRLSR